MFAGKKSAQIREILISESAWEEMTCLFAPSLDDFIARLCKRYNVNLQLKSFVRAHYQIKHKRRETKYVPNFDKYNLEQKAYVLNHYFNKSTENLTDEEIEYNFNKRIAKQVKDIETDVKDAGY
ncbi:hypothetical protein N8Q92_18290 [Enterobacter hormaechei subsp. steigerwaltii]|nr:hypothetical protein [Enterobacter hormaechei subsp. steigerwaltii]MCU2573781.1 hypothetical protein [Enterobacter hormaechei subsp. steigerwaltii]MCU2620449.1 hypothetical protein [Enterobacter hormaechei subsp. steigerwaltii]